MGGGEEEPRDDGWEGGREGGRIGLPATKKVLSPISETKMREKASIKPDGRNWERPARGPPLCVPVGREEEREEEKGS